MSAVFPHDAVVQRYLHTGKRRSRRKIVVASVFGVLACVAVAAALPAKSPKNGAEKSVSAEQAQAKTAPAPQPVIGNVASQTEAPPPKVATAASLATVSSQPTTSHPGTVAAQTTAVLSPNPPATLVAAPSPVAQASAAQAPVAPAPQPVAPLATINQTAAVAPPPVAADQAVVAPASKHANTKLAPKTKRQLAAAEKRKRLARARMQQRYAQPAYAPGSDPAYGYLGGGWQRVFVPQNDNGFD